MSARINDFLDNHVLPLPVRFLTHRFVILATIALLLPLIVFADQTVLVLSINSYLNVMSVAVSSIVLLYATVAEIRERRIAELQEQRAQEDHLHVTEMHELVLQELDIQREEIQELKELVSLLRNQQYQRPEIKPRRDLRAMHPRGHQRFSAENGKHRIPR
ncbi:MAG TPA: hypothetical protein VF932_15175 [Anaerolineae bacterium]